MSPTPRTEPVRIAGAGPAGLACAIHLRRLFAARGMEDKTVLVLEKSAGVGDHMLSGGVMNPKAIAELVPGRDLEWDAVMAVNVLPAPVAPTSAVVSPAGIVTVPLTPW